MPRTELDRLAGDSRIWIFGISPPLDRVQSQTVLRAVDSFLDNWAAHGTPITSARTILEDSFLIVAVDKKSETSGCSIDKMFGLLRQLERDLDVEILDANRVFVRDAGGHVRSLTRAEFREEGDPHTVVFDTTAERLADIRSGRWERKASDSWHAALLPKARA
jgi:hypothetical protein